MALLHSHLYLYRALFDVPGFLADPFLIVGFQDIYLRPDRPEVTRDFEYDHLKDLLQRAKGLKEVSTLDYFDERADRKDDLNIPIPQEDHERFHTVMDIGTLEHIFDTKQALENCLRMIKVGGFYFLHTPINGFFGHGLHMTNPECLVDTLVLNNFDVHNAFYTDVVGKPINHPLDAPHAILWLLAQKRQQMQQFKIPQQRSDTSMPKTRFRCEHVNWLDLCFNLD